MPPSRIPAVVLGAVAMAAAAVVAAPPYFLVRSPAAVALNRDYQGIRLIQDPEARGAVAAGGAAPFVKAAVLGGTAWILAALCGALALSPRRVLLLLLPGTLYFSLNRIDVMPLALVTAGIAFLAWIAGKRKPDARPRIDVPGALRGLTVVTLAGGTLSPTAFPESTAWITPTALLAARSPTELALVVAQDVLSYLHYPVAYDRFGPAAPSLGFTWGLVAATRALLLVSLLGREETRDAPVVPATPA